MLIAAIISIYRASAAAGNPLPAIAISAYRTSAAAGNILSAAGVSAHRAALPGSYSLTIAVAHSAYTGIARIAVASFGAGKDSAVYNVYQLGQHGVV